MNDFVIYSVLLVFAFILAIISIYVLNKECMLCNTIFIALFFLSFIFLLSGVNNLTPYYSPLIIKIFANIGGFVTYGLTFYLSRQYFKNK